MLTNISLFCLSKLYCSDRRFMLLFRNLDGPDGNGKIEKEALEEFLFPELANPEDDSDDDYDEDEDEDDEADSQV